MAIALASLCERHSRAESGSETCAQRTLGLRLAAMAMPMPEPQMVMPKGASPRSSELARR